MFDHPRSDWLPAGESFVAPALQRDRIEQIVIHYIGTARAPRDSKVWMLNEHRRTMSRENPYAFMYNSHVALNGETWEGRGLQFRNAANGSATNPTTWSIVFGVDGQNEASAAQVAGARRLILGLRDHLGRDVPIIPHREIGSTQCPGEGITAQIRSGIFERNPNVSRIAGPNRYATAALVSQHAYPKGANVVYVASGESFADALAAGSCSDGPILLTRKDRLPTETADEIRRLRAKRVLVIGGPSAVSETVLAELERLVI
jgi:hypothetical protein